MSYIRLSIASMSTEKKTIMISGRLPAALVERVDYVTRNIDSDTIKNRSAALREALEAWLPGCEDRLRALGIMAVKVRK
jgi:predicted DNA-binding protein